MSFNAYVKIPSIPGESTDDGHIDWIKILGFSHGVNQPHTSLAAGGSSGGAHEKCDHQPFVVMKEVDRASPKLNLHCCNGQTLGTVKIEVCRQAQERTAYLTYELENCRVRSVMITGQAGASGPPTETVQFAYTKISWKQVAINPKTNVAATPVASWWDMLTGKGG